MIDKSLGQYQQDKKKVKKVKKIKGQKHMLAYITPNEANKLVALGGKKVMTKEGVPAFPEWDNYGMTSSEFSGSSSPSGNGGSEPYYSPTRSVKEEEWATGSYTPPSPAPSGEDQEEDTARMMIDMGLLPNTTIDSDDEYDIDPLHALKTRREINKKISELKSSDQYDTSLTKSQKAQVNRAIQQYRDDPEGTTYDLSDRGADKAFAKPKPSGLDRALQIGSFVTTGGLNEAIRTAKKFRDYQKGKGIYAYGAKKLGLYDPSIKLASNLISPKFSRDELLGTADYFPRMKTFDRPEGDGASDNPLVDKNVITEGRRKYSPEEIKKLTDARDLVGSIVDKGEYKGRRLSDQQIQMLVDKRNELTTLIEAYLVEV